MRNIEIPTDIVGGGNLALVNKDNCFTEYQRLQATKFDKGDINCPQDDAGLQFRDKNNHFLGQIMYYLRQSYGELAIQTTLNVEKPSNCSNRTAIVLRRNRSEETGYIGVVNHIIPDKDSSNKIATTAWAMPKANTNSNKSGYVGVMENKTADFTLPAGGSLYCIVITKNSSGVVTRLTHSVYDGGTTIKVASGQSVSILYWRLQ